jgi:hypothetical protein
MKYGIIASVSSVLFAVMTPASPQTEIEIDYETPAFKERILSSGLVEVSVNYRPFNYEADEDLKDNLHYQITYDGTTYINANTSTFNFGRVWLQDLDSNGAAEVILTTYSGGAHCCTNFTIYTWLGDRFVSRETGYLNAGGGTFEDLNGDGKWEFVTSDNSFLYAFSSYAGSYPPSLIYTFNQGELKDVTRKHVSYLKSQAWQMYQSFLTNQKSDYEINGILAGYVAQKILLGEYEEGWNFMLAHYDPTSDWGLEIYRDNKVVDRYPNFPTALKAFLIESGYLDRNGQPVP